MKSVLVLFFAFIYSLSLVAQTMTCEGLFFDATVGSEDIIFESKRLTAIETKNEKATAKLIVEARPFSQDMDDATLELLRLLVQNSDFKLEDKTVLTKNKFTLGIPFKEGYFFELTYESRSNNQPRFVLQDKIILVTPTGKEIKATDDLLDANELKIKKSEFDLTGLSASGLEIHLRVPLVIEGQLLSQLSKMASYFEYFKKSEIAKIVESQNLKKINTLFRLRKAKDVFINVLIKQPFKSLISGVIMFAVISGQAYIPHLRHSDSALPTTIAQTYIKDTIDSVPAAKNQPQLKKELALLQKKAAAVIRSNTLSHLNYKELNLTTQNLMAKDSQFFVHQQKDAATGQRQTYIVFATEVTSGPTQGLQYFSFEVNPNEFQNLIRFLNNQMQPDLSRRALP